MSFPHQLFRPHVVQDPLCILTVMTALHDGEQQLGRIVLRVKKSRGRTKNLSSVISFIQGKQKETPVL